MQQQENQLQKLASVGGNMSRRLVIAAVLVVIAGVATGYFAVQGGSVGGLGGKVEVAPGAKISGNEIGIEDTKSCKDSTVGILKEGGLAGEGSHHLERDGGPGQNVYLTSSVINLDDFLGKKVEIQGETQKGQKAGWLMDVCKVKIM